MTGLMADQSADGRGALTTPLGRRTFIAGATGAVAGAALLPRTSAAATPDFSSFQVVTPTRLVDTRPQMGDFGYTRVDSKVIRVQVTGREITGSDDPVPADASAAVFTLVGINRSAAGNYLSAYPTGTAWPGTANLNMSGNGDVSPNLVTVKLGTGGAVDVLSNQNSDIVLDLVGVYVPTGGDPVRAGRYKLLPTPKRALDTRNTSKPGADAVVRVDLSSLRDQGIIDADAQAVSANITATQANRGFIAAYPFGTENPGTSTLNVAQDATRGIGTMVKLGVENGRLGFNLYLQSGAHVIVDVAGFMTGESASRSTTGQFVPIEPARLLDTRRGDGGMKRLWPKWTRAFTLPAEYASQASAIAMNLAVTRTMGRGYFTLLGAQMRREEVSNLNVTGPNQTLSNHAITAVSTKGVECYSSAGGDVICDVVGWYKATSAGPSQPDLDFPPADPDPPAAPTPYYINVPRLNLGRNVLSGESEPVVDTGHFWHWTGTGLVGQGHAIATFAHRTEAQGPLRQIHTMVPGDQVALFTGDQRKYTYEYVDRVVTSKDPDEILASTQFRNNEETLAIVACTVGFDASKSAYPDKWAPTSLEWRIIVRMRYVRWEDVIPTT
jgi:Sortase domain